MSLNPKKLINSKWTRVAPRYKEKHFVVVEVEYDELQVVIECVIEAVINKQQYSIDWRDLRNTEYWLRGWK